MNKYKLNELYIEKFFGSPRGILKVVRAKDGDKDPIGEVVHIFAGATMPCKVSEHICFEWDDDIGYAYIKITAKQYKELRRDQ